VAKTAGGKPVSGKYLFVWRQDSGEWRIAADIWTSHEGRT
jgi:ketosteroid isomerase-like protein